jgi:hypothetical protein
MNDWIKQHYEFLSVTGWLIEIILIGILVAQGWHR